MDKKLIEESAKYLMHTYNSHPIVLRKGRGMNVWGDDGTEYIDFVAGIAVNCLGHCHPKVVIAIQKQAQRLLHVSNLYHMEPQIKLAGFLVKNSFADRAFFCNSGTEAVEAAIKLARKYSKEHLSPQQYEIITAYGSFHGRTMASLSATGQERLQKGFEPLLPGFKHVPFNDIGALKKALSRRTCAVLIEPIQGEGGIKMPSKDYLLQVRQFCDENRLVLIFDEIQTGIGRTGKMFAYEHYGVEPDIMTLGKGLGGGVAIGAMLAKERIATAFEPGSHGSTFGGNPLACAAALATLHALIEDGFIMEQCRHTGEYFRNKLLGLQKDFPSLILEVRGLGLMIGMELTKAGSFVVDACAARGMLINCASGNVLRFIPPLIVTERDIDLLVDVLDDIFEKHSH
ncbi:MAG: acetylornithine transaminase [Nitrospira sp.]|nr:acetylornithine transaminase [Nitrospira sp.]